MEGVMSNDMGRVIQFPRAQSTQEQAAVRSNEAVRDILLALRGVNPTSTTQLTRLDEQIRKIEERIRSIKEGKWV
jgi:TolA-binding protein